MKMLTGLICLLLVSSVGCGQQDTASSPAVTGKTTDIAPATSPSSTEPAAAPASAPSAPPAATPENGEAIAAGEEVEQVEEKTSADTANTRLAAAMTAPTPAPASRWEKGKHYQQLVPTQPTNAAPDKIEVVEVFWYGCPHCYALDPYISNWGKKRAPYIEFRQLPVTWGPAHLAHARLFYTIEALGKPELHQAVFREYHIARNPLTSNTPAEAERIQTQFAKRLGLDEETFRKAYHSFEVQTKLQRAEELTRRYLIETVPVIVINGKYKADVTTAGGQSQLISLIDDLAAREHQKN